MSISSLRIKYDDFFPTIHDRKTGYYYLIGDIFSGLNKTRFILTDVDINPAGYNHTGFLKPFDWDVAREYNWDDRPIEELEQYIYDEEIAVTLNETNFKWGTRRDEFWRYFHYLLSVSKDGLDNWV